MAEPYQLSNLFVQGRLSPEEQTKRDKIWQSSVVYTGGTRKRYTGRTKTLSDGRTAKEINWGGGTITWEIQPGAPTPEPPVYTPAPYIPPFGPSPTPLAPTPAPYTPPSGAQPPSWFGGLGSIGELVPRPVDIPGVTIPEVAMPTYEPMELTGAQVRAQALSRILGISPEEEATAIERLSAPAMRQFREEILPQTRGQFLEAGTAWSTMRAGEEAKKATGLAESLAAMGEQYRLTRREQAMKAAGISYEEAVGAVEQGLARYGIEMQPAMQTQLLGTQALLQGQSLTGQSAMEAQRLLVQARIAREAMLAQLLAVPFEDITAI